MTTAELQGPSAAISLAEQELEGLDARREALSLAGDHLLTKGRADPAVKLFEAALKGAYDPDLQSRLELARLSLRAQSPQKDTGPESVVRRIVLAAWTAPDQEAFEAAIRPHLSSRDRKTSEFHRKLNALHTYASRHAKSYWDVTDAKFRAELAVAALDLKPDGQEKVGYRVRLNLLLGDQTFEDVWYVVRENKEYKLLASADDPRPLGAEALRWLDAGHLKEALLWIGWAVEDARGVPPEGLSPLASFANTLRGFSGLEGVTHLRAASAYLGASTGDARVLATLRKQATYASGSERHRLMIALAVAMKAAGNGPDAEALLDEVREDIPTSAEAFSMKREFLSERGRWRALRAAADGRLGLLHSDALGMETLLVAALNEQQWEDVARTGKSLVGQGTASADAYRTLAWAALLRGRVTNEDVQWAQRAVRMSPTGDTDALALLATVLVETGKLEEARKLVDGALEQSSSAMVDPGILYVKARLADAFGLRDAAQTLYRAMPPATGVDARSFQRLGQTRLSRGPGTRSARP
ncbi:tetratricopeptide repeat protein [Myxococcus sp. Y35]|uniref:tetratricopeptide repeat protein n=1 Tax=Pseudomyxococcus flavus TaxID=3115648 RepID=UPI003CF145CC